MDQVITIVGHVTTTAENRRSIMQVCLDHCSESRMRPGCISYNVHVDCENLNRISFVEFWKDVISVRRAFSLPETKAFVRTISSLAETSPAIKIYQVEDLPLEALSG